MTVEQTADKEKKIVERYQPHPILRDLEDAARLSEAHSIPSEDVLLIALNLSGVKYSGPVANRGRFALTMLSGNSYFMALTVTDAPLSPFLHDGKQICLGEMPIASAQEVEADTCATSYWRGGKKHLTLNSNSRSNCKGCSFCGTYNPEGDDKALTNPDALRRKAASLFADTTDGFASVESVGIVTGCFPSENKLVNHLTSVRQVFGEFGFAGEIRYIGSQLRSRDALKEVTSQGPFALHLTVEAFERREQLMNRNKASLSLEGGRQVLAQAKDLGAETCFLYIAGLDGHETMKREFPLCAPFLTQLPQVQTFQAYVPDQLQLRHSDATQIGYYLETRKVVEAAYPHLLPIAENNYRGLWYTKYGQHTLPNAEIWKNV